MKTKKPKLQKPQVSKLFKNSRPAWDGVKTTSGVTDPTTYCTTIISSTHIV